jgi:putative nucleotidyltransferase with HDIG domain
MPSYYEDIESTVIDTFSQWEVSRVGFSWRKYYLDHTRQVQNLALRMARELDADPEQLRFAAILHDITKRYDGAVIKDAEGQFVRNEEGFWLNETMQPHRDNWVTRLYDELGLAGQIHHVSGATLAEHVLREFDFPENFVQPIRKIVAGHLKGRVPPDEHDRRYSEIEVRILYDADTIDPNVGLTAFYRNIQITAGNLLAKGESVNLREYVTANLPRWVRMKDSFRDDMLTDLGRQICDERQERNRRLFATLEDELTEEALNRKYGLLGVVEHLFTNPQDPSITEHLAELREFWLPERRGMFESEEPADRDRAGEALQRSAAFMEALEREIAGG